MISAFFPRAELPEPTVMAWAGELLDLGFDDVAAGIRELSHTSNFPPSLAEVMDAAKTAEDERLEVARAKALAEMPRMVTTADLPKDESPPRRESLERIKRALGRIGKEMPGS